MDIVSKGGNFLLNVGPDADGQFPPIAQQHLREIGRWMRVNSEAIYGTRSIAPYKEGRVCWTHKGRTVYLIVLAEKDETAPPALVKAPSLKQARQVRMLGAADAVKWSTTSAEGLTIEIPESIRHAPPGDHAWTLAVEIENRKLQISNCD